MADTPPQDPNDKDVVPYRKDDSFIDDTELYGDGWGSDEYIESGSSESKVIKQGSFGNRLGFLKNFVYKPPEPNSRRRIEVIFPPRTEELFNRTRIFPVIYNKTHVAEHLKNYRGMLYKEDILRPEGVSIENIKDYQDGLVLIDGVYNNSELSKDFMPLGFTGFAEISSRRELYDFEMGVRLQLENMGVNPKSISLERVDDKLVVRVTDDDDNHIDLDIYSYGKVENALDRIRPLDQDNPRATFIYYEMSDLEKEYNLHPYREIMDFETFLHCTVIYDVAKLRDSLFELPKNKIGITERGDYYKLFYTHLDYSRRWLTKNRTKLSVDHVRSHLFRLITDYIEGMVTYLSMISRDEFSIRDEIIIGELQYQIWRYSDMGLPVY